METDAGVEHFGSMVARVPYICAEPRHVLKGFTPTCVNEDFDKFFAVLKPLRASSAVCCVCTRAAPTPNSSNKCTPGVQDKQGSGRLSFTVSKILIILRDLALWKVLREIKYSPNRSTLLLTEVLSKRYINTYMWTGCGWQVGQMLSSLLTSSTVSGNHTAVLQAG